MSIERTRLANGLTVVTDSMATVETVSVGTWVDVGTRDEHPDVNGVSHLLEHMAFKGTERRNAYAIAAEIEAVGGHLNAYTSREHTAYYAKVLKDDIGLAVDLLGDILQHSVLDADELAREQAVIVQEIHQARDTPDDIVFDHFQETAFPDQPMGRPVLGRPDLVRAMDRQEVLDYMRNHYSAERMILAAAGNLDHDAFVSLAEATFDALPAHHDQTREPARYGGGDFREDRELEQVHVVMGVDGIRFDDPDFYAASVLSTVLGGGMSSRLFQEIRENRGLAYSIYSFLSCYTDGGIFGIYAGTGEDEAGELLPLILDEVDKVRETITEDELARARAQLKSSILMSLESTSSRCEQLARQLMVFGRTIPTDEIVAKVDAVDTDAVTGVARRLFHGTPTLAALGPVGSLCDFERLAGRLN
ncbi:MAG: pitrilysin family protein [Magnetovibrio sp.]|nr:pitrilysin family protein [Magnetovibrio sp.]